MNQWSKVCAIVDKVLATHKLSTSDNKLLLAQLIDNEEIDELIYPTKIHEKLEKKRKKIKQELDRLTVIHTQHKTFLKFIAHRRLEQTVDLFKHESNCSVKRIAYLAGFNNPSNFTKKFKSVYAHLPKDYLAAKALTK